MPITLLDIILIGVMADFGAARHDPRVHARNPLDRRLGDRQRWRHFIYTPSCLPYAKSYFNNDIVAAGVVIGGTFLVTLLSYPSSRCASRTWFWTAASAHSTERLASCLVWRVA